MLFDDVLNYYLICMFHDFMLLDDSMILIFHLISILVSLLQQAEPEDQEHQSLATLIRNKDIGPGQTKPFYSGTPLLPEIIGWV